MSKDNHGAGDFHLKGKSVVITGGARGIGRAISLLFASRGASVYILDLDAPQATAVVKEIIDRRGNAGFFTCDVADRESVQDCFSQILRLGRIHALVNSAGIAHVGSLESTLASDFESVFRVNVIGVFNCMQAVVSHMKKKGGG